jgi:hypothetical protein
MINALIECLLPAMCVLSALWVSIYSEFHIKDTETKGQRRV